MSNLGHLNQEVIKLYQQGKINKSLAMAFLSRMGGAHADSYDPIAVIGMACRFPGANSIDEYWYNIINKVASLGEFPPHRRKDVERIFSDPDSQRSYAIGGYLDEIDLFDATRFRVLPKEARLMNPLQRILLETSWEACKNSGFTEETLRGSLTGIFVGREHTSYSPPKFSAEYKDLFNSADMLGLTGNATGILASRVSYAFDLKGPAVVIDTACSSGLVALHVACRSLQAGECKTAIVGGIHLTLAPLQTALLMIETSEQEIRAFDYDAKGTLWGEGAGVVLLKTLSQAMADGDNVLAVIKGSVANNDGATNGISAPSARAQEELLVNAWRQAQVNPETIGYIETHGTGTQLGDQIEMRAISNAFARFTKKRQFCGIGSVKNNIGHTVGAAGIASFIKVVLAMRNKIIPPSINFSRPNSSIPFVGSPIYFCDQVFSWEGHPKRAGVSSFGISGTNCHVVIEEANQEEKVPPVVWKSPINRVRFWPSADSVSKREFQIINKRSELLNESEVQLGEIVADVLEMSEIDVEANFHDLGMDSILGMHLLAQIRTTLKKNILYSDILGHPSVECLAVFLAGVSDEIDENKDKIHRVEEKPEYDLSAAQARLFVLHHMSPNDLSYNLSFGMRVKKTLEPDLIIQSVRHLIDRHETLRTSFRFGEHGKPVQIVHQKVRSPVSFIKLGSNSLRTLAESLNQPFVLEEAPLFRVTIVEECPHSYFLLIYMHHIISDGRSLRVFASELMQSLEGRIFAPPKIQFKDFVYWQNQSALTPEYEQQRIYWLKQFDGEIPIVNLPTDFGRPLVQTKEGGVISIQLDQGGLGALKQFARENNVTLYMVLVAAYLVLLSKYSGQDDIVVGTAVEGRTHPDLFDSIGMFVNVLPIRAHVYSHLSLKEFLRNIRETTLGAFRYQEFQFSDLIEALRLVPDASRNPLFDTMFTLQHVDPSQISSFENGGQYEGFDLDRAGAQLDIVVEAFEVGERLKFNFSYAKSLYVSTRMNKFVSDYCEILHALPKMGEQPISRLKSVPGHNKLNRLRQLAAQRVGIAAEDIVDIYPASAMQSLMIEETLMDNGKRQVYHVNQKLHIHDKLASRILLEQAIKWVIPSVVALNSGFMRTEDGIVQVLYKNRQPHIRNGNNPVRDIYREESDFILPPFRVNICELSSNVLQLELTWHYSLMDGCSSIELLNRIFENYWRFKHSLPGADHGSSSNLPKELIALERVVSQSPKSDEFWRSYLCSGIQSPSFQKPFRLSSDVVVLEVRRPSGYLRRMEDFAAKNQVAVEAIFLFAYGEILRLIGLDEAWLGVILNGRSLRLSNATNAIGQFWRLLPIRVFKPLNLLEGIRKYDNDWQAINSQERMHYSFDKVIEECSGSSPFSCGFRFSRIHGLREASETDEIQVRLQNYEDQFHLPLNLWVNTPSSYPGQFAIRLSFDTAFISQSQGDQFMAEIGKFLDTNFSVI